MINLKEIIVGLIMGLNVLLKILLMGLILRRRKVEIKSKLFTIGDCTMSAIGQEMIRNWSLRNENRLKKLEIVKKILKDQRKSSIFIEQIRRLQASADVVKRDMTRCFSRFSPICPWRHKVWMGQFPMEIKLWKG